MNYYLYEKSFIILFFALYSKLKAALKKGNREKKM